MGSPSNDLFKRVIQQERDSKEFGFYWESLEQLIAQVKSECDEIKEAADKGDKRHLKEEVGDLINAAISLCIFCQLDPHDTLAKSADKYQNRYETLVKLAQEEGYTSLTHQPFEILMYFWNKAKQQLSE